MKTLILAGLLALSSLPTPAFAQSAAPRCADVFDAGVVSLSEPVARRELEKSAAQDIAELPKKTTKKNFNLFKYYFDKLRELKELDRSAPYAVILRGLILSTSNKIEKVTVPLKQLHLIHPITRGASIEKLTERTNALKAFAERKNSDAAGGRGGVESGGKLVLDAATMDQVIPSKNLMRSVQDDRGDYVIFDGNGRLVAIHDAFPDGNVLVEIEVYRSQSKLMRFFLRKVREIRGVLPDDDASPDFPLSGAIPTP